MERLIRRVGGLVTDHPWFTLTTVVGVTVMLGWFAGQQEQVDDAEAGTGEAAAAADLIEEQFGDDTVAVQVIVTTAGRDVVNVDALDAVLAIGQAIAASDAAERIESVADGPPVLSFLSPAQLALGTAARLAIRTTTGDDPGTVGSDLPSALDDAFAPVEAAGVEVVATSDDIIAAELSDDIRSSQLIAMALAMTVAVTLLAIYFGLTARRPLLGALTVVPVALVIAWTFGAMAVTGIPLTPVTATLAALAIGIGSAIHVLNRYLEASDGQGSIDDALRITAESTGAALIGSAVTTLAGFGVLLTSDIVPFQQLGAVTAFAIGFSLLAAVLVFPSVLALADRSRGD